MTPEDLQTLIDWSIAEQRDLAEADLHYAGHADIVTRLRAKPTLGTWLVEMKRVMSTFTPDELAELKDRTERGLDAVVGK